MNFLPRQSRGIPITAGPRRGFLVLLPVGRALQSHGLPVDLQSLAIACVLVQGCFPEPRLA